MTCPMFVDFARECLFKIKFVPKDTFAFCTTDAYPECPFYKTLNKIGDFCDFIDTCPMYARFAVGQFDMFVDITKQYCLSKNCANCSRYKIRKAGNQVPVDLLPDGKKL